MKIVYLTNSDIRGNEPGVSFVSYNAAGFAAAGADFHLVAAGDPEHGGEEVLKSRFGVEGINLHLIKPRKILGSRAPYYLQLKKRLQSLAPDVIISRNLNCFPYIKSWAAKKNIDLYFEAHNFYFDLSERSAEQAKKLSRMRNLEISSMPSMAGVICVSEAQAECYRKSYPQTPVLGASTGCRPPDDNNRSDFDYSIGYVGSMTEGKYLVETLVEALTHTKSDQVRLVAAGAKDADVERLSSLAKKLGVDNRVQIHGWKTGEELEELMSNVDVMCAPLSESDFLNRIASPLKVLDAFSRSKPIIATNLTGIAALLSDKVHGRLVTNDPINWAEAIDWVFSDIDEYRLMSKQCHTKAQELSWENRAKKILQFLKEKNSKI